eukprot:scaffold133457_cov58-Phaeocystis_antarctica.AAC.1
MRAHARGNVWHAGAPRGRRWPHRGCGGAPSAVAGAARPGKPAEGGVFSPQGGRGVASRPSAIGSNQHGIASLGEMAPGLGLAAQRGRWRGRWPGGSPRLANPNPYPHPNPNPNPNPSPSQEAHHASAMRRPLSSRRWGLGLGLGSVVRVRVSRAAWSPLGEMGVALGGSTS